MGNHARQTRSEIMARRALSPEVVAQYEAAYQRVKGMYPVGYEGYIINTRPSEACYWGAKTATVIRHNKTTLSVSVEGKNVTLSIDERPTCYDDNSHYRRWHLTSKDDGEKTLQQQKDAEAKRREQAAKAEKDKAERAAKQQAIIEAARGREFLTVESGNFCGLTIKFTDGYVINIETGSLGFNVMTD
jgi:hypothetical protein